MVPWAYSLLLKTLENHSSALLALEEKLVDLVNHENKFFFFFLLYHDILL